MTKRRPRRGGFALGFAGTLTIVATGSCTSGVVPPPPQAAPTVVRPAEPTPARGFSYQGALSQGGLVIGTAPVGAVSLTLDGNPVPIERGRFLIAFGRDHGTTATVEARLADGRIVRDVLTIVPRAWQIESLPIPRGTSPSPEFLRRRAAETAQINAARRVVVQSDGWRQRFLWPVTGRISGLFGSQRVYNGEHGVPHSGVDIARPEGTPVAAPADGVVILAAESPFTLEGNLLMIGHGMGLDSQFLHLSRIDVRAGDRVVRGQTIGAIGMTGRATGPHLHWGMRWRTERLDPMLAAGPMPADDPLTPR